MQVIAQFRTANRASFRPTTWRYSRETAACPYEDAVPEEWTVAAEPKNVPVTCLELFNSFQNAVHRPSRFPAKYLRCSEKGNVPELLQAAHVPASQRSHIFLTEEG